ncbi:hypothetical protein STEG23_005568 [Scotinomys teguina]
MDINTDPDCGTATDPDMALNSSSRLDDSLALCGSTAHSDRLASHVSSKASAWPLVLTGATDINTDLGCGCALDPDMALGCSSGLDISLALGDKQATHVSLLLTTFASSDLSLSTGHEPFSLLGGYFLN